MAENESATVAIKAVNGEPGAWGFLALELVPDNVELVTLRDPGGRAITVWAESLVRAIEALQGRRRAEDRLSLLQLKYIEGLVAKAQLPKRALCKFLGSELTTLTKSQASDLIDILLDPKRLAGLRERLLAQDMDSLFEPLKEG